VLISEFGNRSLGTPWCQSFACAATVVPNQRIEGSMVVLPNADCNKMYVQQT
jgi:hypothetical protein